MPSLRNQDSALGVFRRLPTELLLHFLSVVDFNAVVGFSETCREFHLLANDTRVWGRQCEVYFGLSDRARRLAIRRNPSLSFKHYFVEKFTLSQPDSLWWQQKRLRGKLAARYSHSASVVGKYVVFIGGEVNSAHRFNDVHMLSGESHKIHKIKVKSEEKLSPLSRHQACSHNGKVYVFGGFDGVSKFNNLSIYEVTSKTWTMPMMTGPVPRPRSNHACAVVGDKLYLFGGNNQHETGQYQILGDFSALDLKTMKWEDLSKSKGKRPSARSGHRLVAAGSLLYLFGGGQWDDRSERWLNKFNDVYIFNTATLRWSRPKISGKAEVCTFPSVVRCGLHLLVFGGQSMNSSWTTNAIFLLDTVMMEWRQVKFEADAVRPRCRDMASLTMMDEKRCVLFGGNHSGPQSDFHFLRLGFKVSDYLPVARVDYDRPVGQAVPARK